MTPRVRTTRARQATLLTANATGGVRIMRSAATLAVVLLTCSSNLATAKQDVAAASPLPLYLWFEPEWFEGVAGNFGYWSGGSGSCNAPCNHTGFWGVAGPGVSAEMSTGGESEWNSMGVPADNAKAECHRAFAVPRAGTYKIWVRYYDHWNQTEPFRATVTQGGAKITGELGVLPVVPPNDEYQLYWGFSFGWASVEGNLTEGPATLSLSVERVGENFRQVDAVLITDDLEYLPYHRYAYTYTYSLPLICSYKSNKSLYTAGRNRRSTTTARSGFNRRTANRGVVHSIRRRSAAPGSASQRWRRRGTSPSGPPSARTQSGGRTKRCRIRAR